MKINLNTDLVAFLREVEKCAGEVWFETKQGDKLNLKSMLSQYLFVALTGDQQMLGEGAVICEQEADRSLLANSPYIC